MLDFTHEFEEDAVAMAARRSEHDTIMAMKAKIRSGWCRGRNAANACGGDAFPRSPNATAWCLNGALVAVTNDTLRIYRVREYFRRDLGSEMEPWNDHVAQSKDEVLAACDRVAVRVLRGEIDLSDSPMAMGPMGTEFLPIEGPVFIPTNDNMTPAPTPKKPFWEVFAAIAGLAKPAKEIDDGEKIPKASAPVKELVDA